MKNTGRIVYSIVASAVAIGFAVSYFGQKEKTEMMTEAAVIYATNWEDSMVTTYNFLQAETEADFDAALREYEELMDEFEVYAEIMYPDL